MPMNNGNPRLSDIMKAVIPILSDARTVVLTTHVNPDGDGLGCELALAEWLSARGCSVRIVNHSPTPSFYRFLDRNTLIHTFDPASDGACIADAEVICIVDMNQPERLKSMEQAVMASRAVKIVIDHHLEPHPFAQHYVVDVDATSAGEIVYRLLSEAHSGTFTPDIATALYCAIMTDTGSFRYPRVDPETHRIVADLIGCGADPVAIYSSVYEQWSIGRIRLLGEMLAGMEVRGDGRLACVTISREMLAKTGTIEEDTDNFTTYPMSIEGVVAGILFLELRDGVKISVRSKGDIPINLLAKEFGGNGHVNAAGARVFGMSLVETRRLVIAAAMKYLPVRSSAEENP